MKVTVKYLNSQGEKQVVTYSKALFVREEEGLFIVEFNNEYVEFEIKNIIDSTMKEEPIWDNLGDWEQIQLRWFWGVERDWHLRADAVCQSVLDLLKDGYTQDSDDSYYGSSVHD